jgi:putative SOS response-associated peptidase YedK
MACRPTGVKRGATGQEILSGAIVTTTAIENLAMIHDRMPVFLPASAWPRWLAPDPLSADEAASIMGTALPHAMTTLAVRPLVNSIRNEGEELLRPAVTSAPASPEPDLFG